MTKFILWLSLVFGGADVLFVRDITPTNGAMYDAGADDWHCGKCGGNLCAGCGYCISCERCHCR